MGEAKFDSEKTAICLCGAVEITSKGAVPSSGKNNTDSTLGPGWSMVFGKSDADGMEHEVDYTASVMGVCLCETVPTFTDGECATLLC